MAKKQEKFTASGFDYGTPTTTNDTPVKAEPTKA